jgi:ribosome-binding protein aMBF1 (putative translation factor)
MTKAKQHKSEHGSEILPIQVKMARTALGWGVRELAAAAKISGDTVNRLERGDELKERTVAAVKETFEKAGVEFIPENGGGAGVRLAKRKAKR